ncbi:IS5 family transposase [Streptomyces sp. NPDC047061]|uniref:IS5 family transposase n=1 Tax=Streptomyces sp. NPDC047061 TaxID=3154605 RepID=UPI0033CBFF90
MTGRGELTDAAWEALKPLLPATDGPGRPWRDRQQVINGVLWRLRTGAPWRDLPERYGPWQTVYERFARWERDGTWARLLEHIQARDDSVGAVEWTVSVDSTINRSHQHAAGIRASELARASGQHKQVIGSLVDDLEHLGYVERRPDPADRRAKLVVPTERGLLQMAAAAAIMRSIEERHARALGEAQYATFKAALHSVAELPPESPHDTPGDTA